MSRSIPALFREQAGSRADTPLLFDGTASTTFAEIDRQSDGVALALRNQGVDVGERVALYCINGAEFVAAYLGILKAGAVVVPVNLLIGATEAAFVLNDAGARGLIYHQALVEKAAAFRGNLDALDFAVCIGDQKMDAADLAFSDCAALSGDLLRIDIDPATALAAILYTSGTTGNPKGAMLSHENLIANTRSVMVALQLRPGEDRLLVVLPMFHAFAATVGMLTPLLHGLTIVPVPKFDPVLVSDLIEAAGATVFLGVPSMYGAILRLPDSRLTQWRGIRYGVSGGAAMPVALMEQFEQRFALPILEGDGPTECSPVTCVNPVDGIRKPASVGLPVPDVEMAIFDDAGRRLQTDEIGEICVRGPNVMRGYWHLPEATAETMLGDWLRTGDLGYIDEDGYIFMVDRKKDLVIVNGMNVYPRMVEETLFRHPDILEAAVVGEPHESHGEIVVAHVVPKEGAELDDKTVKAWCREHLGQHQRPRKVILRESLPKNATGKILKRELRKEGELERGVDSRGDGS